MTTPVRRTNHRVLPDLLDWAESFSPLIGLRTMSALQGIRIEDYIDNGNYVVRAELPGVDPDKDVTITVMDRLLTITAERTDKVDEANHSEFRYGSFARTITLPAEAKEDTLKATYADGILTVTVTMDETKKAQRKIAIEHKK